MTINIFHCICSCLHWDGIIAQYYFVFKFWEQNPILQGDILPSLTSLVIYGVAAVNNIRSDTGVALGRALLALAVCIVDLAWVQVASSYSHCVSFKVPLSNKN